MAMEDEKYLKSVEGFINTSEDKTYVVPKISGITPFTLVDQSSKENLVSGIATKYCLRAKKELLSELNDEMKNNPICSYDTCFTKEEYKNNSISSYSIFLKEEPILDIECEVLGSRIFNFYGIDTVYNKRIDVKRSKSTTDSYVLSVDCLKPNERFFDLFEVAFLRGGNLLSIHADGVDKTIDGIAVALCRFFDKNEIKYTQKQIDDYKSFLVYSYIIRVLLLGDNDYRNGNAGIIVNEKDKTFRAFPNFDFNLLFDSEQTENKLNIIDDIAVSYPKVLDDFLLKTEKFLSKRVKSEESACESIFKESIKRKTARENLANIFYSNVALVVGRAMNAKKEISEMEQLNFEKQ